MNITKTLKSTRWLTLTAVPLLIMAGVLAASLTIGNSTALAGGECVDNWCVGDPDLNEARGIEMETSILPADMDVIDLLVFSIWIMTAGVGVLAVGGIVWGAIMYASAGDSQEKSKKGIEIIRNVAIGLLLYVFMFAAINFLIPGGVIS